MKKKYLASFVVLILFAANTHANTTCLGALNAAGYLLDFNQPNAQEYYTCMYFESGCQDVSDTDLGRTYIDSYVMSMCRRLSFPPQYVPSFPEKYAGGGGGSSGGGYSGSGGGSTSGGSCLNSYQQGWACDDPHAGQE